MYVAFVDLLGFADAVEGLTEEQADYFTRMVSETVGSSRALPPSALQADMSVRKLYQLYTSFQAACDRAVWRLSQFSAYTRFQANYHKRHSPFQDSNLAAHRAVVFSDSVFLASTALEPILDASGEMIAGLILRDFPARGAIAKGHFHTFEWKLRAGLSNSFHADAPFLGSGVIRAYRAESKGPRGIRLLIHESCRDDLRALDSWSLIPLPN